jgi:D-alanyl-D-alanine carboxypeptidase (penicillin-binding protein 5/6)
MISRLRLPSAAAFAAALSVLVLCQITGPAAAQGATAADALGATGPPAGNAPTDPAPIPEPPPLDAQGWLLVSHDSGMVLAAANAEARLEPASLTKIMTAYVVFLELAAENLALDDQVPISEKAWRTGGSKMFIEVGKQISLEALLKGMIVQSGNDASVALAETVAGSEAGFAALMNREAERLGMTHSHFVNATGLPDPEHYTTPEDIAKVASAMIRDFPQYYAWYSEREFTFNGIRQFNRNRLLALDPSVDGIKTGHTEAAGYCLVASAERDGERLISVVMGTDSKSARAEASMALLNWGFRFFETHVVYRRGQPVQELRVWSGDKTELAVGPAADLAVTIPRGSYARLSARLEPMEDITAPVAQGQVVGEIFLTLDGREILRRPARALETIDRGGLVRRGIDAVLKLF